jgi:hypothetical protein
MCTSLLPSGDNPIAVNKYIITSSIYISVSYSILGTFQLEVTERVFLVVIVQEVETRHNCFPTDRDVITANNKLPTPRPPVCSPPHKVVVLNGKCLSNYLAHTK